MTSSAARGALTNDAVGETFDIPGHRRIVREVEDVVKRWPEFAAEAGPPDERTIEVATRLDAITL